MKNLLNILNKKPALYEQTDLTMWDDPHISKGMLEAHLNDSMDSATRHLKFVERSVEWISTIAPPKSHPNLLDLGCGPGIYATRFCEKGYDVTGIDLSRRSIEYANKDADSKGLNIQFMLGDYTKLSFEKQYHVITLIYCDFGVLAPEVRSALLQKVYDALLPNGILIFDVFTSSKYDQEEETRSWEITQNGFWNEKQCITYTSFFRYEENHTFLKRYTVVTKDDEMYNYHVWEHTFTCEELRENLIQAGFNDVQFYGNMIGDLCNEDDEVICVVAKKIS